MRFVLFFIFIGFNSFAHLGTILGKVSDRKNHSTLHGASIFVQNQGISTDINGNFRFENLKPGKYAVKVSMVGYTTQFQNIELVSDEVINLDFQLEISDVQLSEIKIVANSGLSTSQMISNIDIKLRLINNSQEILRIIPGLVIGQHAGGGKAEQIFLRGFDLDHGTDINLTADGVPINMVSHAHGQGYADCHFIIPELISNVEFEKGLYEPSKGNFTTAGWANFNTKSTLENNFIKTEIGQFNTFRIVSGLNLIHNKPKHNLFIADEYSSSDSYFENSQKFKRLNIFAKYHGHLSDKSTLSLTLSTFWSQWNASGQIPDRAVRDGSIGWFGSIDPNEGGKTIRTNFNAQLLTLTKKNQVWKNQLYFSNYNFSLFSNFTFFLEDPINGDQIKQAENRNLFGYNSDYSVYHEMNEKSAHFNFGLNLRNDFTTNSQLAHTKNRTQVLENIMLGNITETNLGLFVEEMLQINSKWTITAGLRCDKFYNKYLNKLDSNTIGKTAAQIISPKLNLNFTPNQYIQYFLNTGKGFHSNDTRAVVAKNGLEVLPAAYGADLGLISKPMPKMIFNAAFWYLWLAQEFIYVGDAGVVEAIGKTRRYGFDVALRYQLTNNIFFDANANWAKPRAIGIAEGQNYLPLAVKFTSTGGITLKNDKGLSGSFRFRNIGNRPANEDNSIVAKGYFITDLLLNYPVKNITYGLSIQNLFNTKWKETQFATLTKLKSETQPVNEICFSPGTPFNAKISIMFNF